MSKKTTKCICPICKESCSESLYKHLNKSNKKEEQNFLLEQTELIKKFFLKNGFDNYDQLNEFGIKLSAKACRHIIYHTFSKDKIDEVVNKFNSIECPYCKNNFYKKNIFDHIKNTHKKEFDVLENYVKSLFYNNDFYPTLNIQLFNLPMWLDYRNILSIWKDNFSQEEYSTRTMFNRILSLTLSRQKKSATLENIREVYIKTKNFMKYSNNNKCFFCKETVTNKTWINHYKTYHKDFFNSQVRLAIQCFDNFNITTQEDYYNFGLRCDLYTLSDLWKEIFGEDVFKTRTNIYSGREAAIAKYGFVEYDYTNNDIQGDDKLLLDELKEKHTKFILQYNSVQDSRKHFKLKSGTLVPRLDIPQYKGFRSTWEANIARMFIYNNKRFDYEIPFEIPDIHNECKCGKRFYVVDFIDYDNMFGFGENTYVEVKGYYDERAKEKERLFKETYPNKKLIFIGIPDEKSNFYPEINYFDLQNNYQKKISYWETKQYNIFSNPQDFIPQEFIDKILITYKWKNQKEKEMKLDINNCYNCKIPSKKKLKQLYKTIDFSKFTKKNNYKYDLCAYFDSFELANICRVLNYHKKKYETNVLFLLHDKDDFLIHVDLIDCENFFGFGNDVCILLKNDYISIFEKNFPNRIFKVFDCYNELEKQYYDKILLWETKRFNSYIFPQYFNQELNEEECDEIYKLK